MSSFLAAICGAGFGFFLGGLVFAILAPVFDRATFHELGVLYFVGFIAICQFLQLREGGRDE